MRKAVAVGCGKGHEAVQSPSEARTAAQLHPKIVLWLAAMECPSRSPISYGVLTPGNPELHLLTRSLSLTP